MAGPGFILTCPHTSQDGHLHGPFLSMPDTLLPLHHMVPVTQRAPPPIIFLISYLLPKSELKSQTPQRVPELSSALQDLPLVKTPNYCHYGCFRSWGEVSSFAVGGQGTPGAEG